MLAGVPIKTAVAPHLLESAFEGRVQATALPFGTPCSGTVRPRPLECIGLLQQSWPVALQALCAYN